MVNNTAPATLSMQQALRSKPDRMSVFVLHVRCTFSCTFSGQREQNGLIFRRNVNSLLDTQAYQKPSLRTVETGI